MVMTFYLVLVVIAQLLDNKASALGICFSNGTCVERSFPEPRSTQTTSTSTTTSTSDGGILSTINSVLTSPSEDLRTTSPVPLTSPVSPTSSLSLTPPTRGQTNTASSQTSQTSVSSIAASTQQVAPQISFLLDILTTCEPATLRWTGSNVDNITLNLTITSTDIPHTNSDFTLANAINASTNVYKWSKVTIPQGKYMLNALDEFNTRTLATGPFLVENGTDVSCLVANGMLNATSIERPSPTSSTNPSSSPSQSNTIVPNKPSLNIPVIIGATIGSVLFLVMVLSLGYRYLQRKARQIKPKPIDPYPTEYTKSRELRRSKFRDDEGSESNNDAAPAQNHVQAPEMQARIHRHEDSGWRPPPPVSESMSSNLIHMPPEYENAL
ncbi:hypothetical protein VNI00_014195 [Paramarasmius palmivorus]|uniref:Uncharacterized protein n=1 Tax=Paramarasmius palmivorus TaxID=297713 RepID=A0AAW0BWF3_9AGAR